MCHLETDKAITCQRTVSPARSTALRSAPVASECLRDVDAELERVLKLELDPERVMLGINNRDLQTFEVDLQNNQRIMDSSAGKEVRMIPDTVWTTTAVISTYRALGRCQAVTCLHGKSLQAFS